MAYTKHKFLCIYRNVYVPEINSTSLFYLLVQAQLDEQLAGLQTLTAARRSKLEESIKLHQYLQDVEEVLSWLSDKESIASSNDYGKDFEHLQVRHFFWFQFFTSG